MELKKVISNIAKSKKILKEDEALSDDIRIRDALRRYESYMKMLSMRDPTLERTEIIQDGKKITEYNRHSDATHVKIVQPVLKKDKQ